MKPEIIMCYNKGKQGIDISDQMASYFTPLRKTVRWYHKIGYKFLLNTAVVNALVIYNEIRGNQKTQIAKFRHDLIYSLAEMKHLQDKNVTQATRSSHSSAVSTLPHHHLEKYSERDCKNRLKRKRCSGCYSETKKNGKREEAGKKAKKESTYCKDCQGQPAFCMDCFAKHH